MRKNLSNYDTLTASPDYDPWTKVKVLQDDVMELFIGLLASTIGIHVEGERLDYSNGIG